MKPEPLYIRKERSRIEGMTNENLFSEMLSLFVTSGGDMADERDFAYRDLYESVCRERLKEWLKMKGEKSEAH